MSKVTWLGQVTETTSSWNLYEALSGRFFLSFESPPDLEEVILGTTLPSRFQPRKIQREINETIKKARSVVTQSAQRRYAVRLSELGIPIMSESTSVDDVEPIHAPLYVALLLSGERQRLVAIDAMWGRRWSGINAVLTEQASYVSEAIGWENDGTPDGAARQDQASAFRGYFVLAVIAVVEFLVFGNDIAVLFGVYFLTGVATLVWARASRV